MKYKEYGRTGLNVSVLGLGSILRARYSTGKSNAGLLEAIIKEAYELGVNYFDTARNYGKSESILGKSVKSFRENVFISTKNLYQGSSAAEWEKILNRSLKELGTDYIDFYHLHDLRLSRYNKNMLPGKIMDRFRKLKEKGVVRHMCFSSHDKPENIIKLIDTGEFEGMLVQYNLLDRTNEEAIAYACKKKMGVAIMGPVGGGRLAGPSGIINPLSEGSKSTPETALRFVYSNPNVTLALSGMISLEMLGENVITASKRKPLANKEKDRIISETARIHKLSDLKCTGCRYCSPCPHNVSIPGNLEALYYCKVWGLSELAKAQYMKLKKRFRNASAEACRECGKCEPKCPQNIPIRKQLKEAARVLGSK